MTSPDDARGRRRPRAAAGSRHGWGRSSIGISQYELRDQVIALLHTEIDADQEGKGYGSQLARAVLADVRARDVSVIVRCPFLAAYVRRHQADYPDIDLRAGKTQIAG